jgi:hypothetical protein
VPGLGQVPVLVPVPVPGQQVPGQAQPGLALLLPEL